MSILFPQVEGVNNYLKQISNIEFLGKTARTVIWKKKIVSLHSAGADRWMKTAGHLSLLRKGAVCKN